MNRQPKHSDLDSDLADIGSPMGIFWSMVFLATGLIFITCWLLLFAAMAAGWLPWLLWPYVWLPIVAWAVLLAIPALFAARGVALGVLNLLAITVEAWAERAGFSIDLNRDGRIGWNDHPIQVEPPPQLVRPLLISSQANQGIRLLAHDAPAAFPDAPGPDPAPPPVATRQTVWILPNEATIPRATMEHFIESMFVRGWGRDKWVGPGKPMERKQHDGLLMLFDQTGVITGRGKGNAGSLALATPAAVKDRLNLTTPPPGRGNALAGLESPGMPTQPNPTN